MKQEVIDTLIKFKEDNEDIVVTGSLALNLLGFETRREPIDLDLYINSNLKINWRNFEIINEKDLDDEDKYQIKQYRDLSNKVKINVFEPLSRDYCVIYNNLYPTITIRINGISIKVLKPKFILKFKIEHILSNESSFETKQKYKADIIYFLQNNNFF